MKISTVYYSKKKPICKEIKNVILTYFYDKTTLDGIPEKAYFRMKQKNKLNGIYGMYVTNPCKNDYKMDNLKHLVEEDTSTTEEELLDHFYNSFTLTVHQVSVGSATLTLVRLLSSLLSLELKHNSKILIPIKMIIKIDVIIFFFIFPPFIILFYSNFSFLFS